MKNVVYFLGIEGFNNKKCYDDNYGICCIFWKLRNPGRDISFPIFTRKRIGKEIKTIISRLNDLSSFLSNIEQNSN